MSEYSTAIEDFLAIDDAMGAVLTLTERNDLQQAIRNLEGNFENAQKGWATLHQQLSSRVESLMVAIECLVADEVISAERARELHGLPVEAQQALWRMHPNDLYFIDPCLACAGSGHAPNCTPTDRERGDLWACGHCAGSGRTENRDLATRGKS